MQFSCRFFSFLPISSGTESKASHKHGLAAKTIAKREPPKSLFETNFLWKAGSSETETSVSGKCIYSLAIKEDKK